MQISRLKPIKVSWSPRITSVLQGVEEKETGQKEGRQTETQTHRQTYGINSLAHSHCGFQQYHKTAGNCIFCILLQHFHTPSPSAAAAAAAACYCYVLHDESLTVKNSSATSRMGPTAPQSLPFLLLVFLLLCPGFSKQISGNQIPPGSTTTN